MKRRSILTYVIAISLAFGLHAIARAQCADTIPKPPIPASVFPFGGFDCDNAVNEWSGANWCNLVNAFKDAGLNTMWFSIDEQPPFQARLAKSFRTGTQLYKGAEGTFDYLLIGSWERRFCLVTDGNDGPFEFDQHSSFHHWFDDQAGGYAAIPGALVPATGEWKMVTDPSATTMQFVIDTKKHAASGDWANGPDKDVFATFNADGSNVVNADLIYRVASPGNNTTPIFTVSVQVFDNGRLLNSTGPLTVTYQTYNDYINTTPAAHDASDPKAIRSFRGQSYAVLRLGAITVPAPHTDTTIERHIVVTITSNQVSNIYVRGLRFRNGQCDQLLKGQQYAQMRTSFDNVLNPLKAYSGSGYQQVTTISMHGESSGDAYRAIAYCDDLFFKYSRGKRLNGFLWNGAIPYYRAIYEDQNGYPPPAMLNETSPMTGKDQGWPHQDGSAHWLPPAYPRDGVEWDILHPELLSWVPPDYLGNHYTFDDLGYGLAQPVANGLSDYSTYTAAWQRETSRNFSIQNQAGFASYLHGAFAPWHDMPWINITQVTKALTRRNIEDSRFIQQVRSPVLESLKKGNTIPSFSLYDLYADGQVNSNEIDDGVNTGGHRATLSGECWCCGDHGQYAGGNSANYEVIMRKSLFEEQRAQAWSGIVNGAKGLYFNVIGNDGGENVGLTDGDMRYDYDGIILPGSDHAIKPFHWFDGFGDPSHPFIGYDPSGDTNYNYTAHLVMYTGSTPLPTTSMTVTVNGIQHDYSYILNPLQWIPISKSEGDINGLTAQKLWGWRDPGNGNWVTEFGVPTSTFTFSADWKPTASTWGAFHDNLRLGPGPQDEYEEIYAPSGTSSGYYFKMTFRNQPTCQISYTATHDDIYTALSGLSSIPSNSVECSGGPLGSSSPIVIHFKGDLGNRPIELPSIQGYKPDGTTTDSYARIYEQPTQVLSVGGLSGVSSSSQFTLKFRDPVTGNYSQPTTALPYTVTATGANSVQSALQALTSIGSNVTCVSTGNANDPLSVAPIKIQFTGTLNNGPIELLQIASTDGHDPHAGVTQQRGLRWFAGYDYLGLSEGAGMDPSGWNEHQELKGWLPTYTGFKQSFQSAQRIEQDLEPIVPLLAKLHWQGSIQLQDVSYTDATSGYGSGTDWQNYPIKENVWNTGGNNPTFQDRTLQKMQRYTLTPTPRETGANLYEMPPYADYDHEFDDPAIGGIDATKSYPYDPSVYRHLTIGRFKNNPDEPSASYVAVTNPRTWPLRYQWPDMTKPGVGLPVSIYKSDPDAPFTATDGQKNLLGAIDRRRFNFKLNASVVDPSNDTHWFDVLNLRTGEEFTKDITQEYDASRNQLNVFHADLDPGEGTLIRIAPATAADLGRTNFMGYNNAHRVAEMHSAPVTGCVGPGARAVCWESNGAIVVQIVPAAGPINQIITQHNAPYGQHVIYTPSSSHQDDGHNPSIAVHPAQPFLGTVDGDTICVVFSSDDFIHHSLPRQLHIFWSTWPYMTWNEVTPLPAALSPMGYHLNGVSDVTGNGADLMVPAVSAAANGGFVGVETQYSGWRAFELFFQNPSAPKQVVISPIDGYSNNYSQVRFAGIATHDDLTPRADVLHDHYHFAWEEDYADGTSAIWHAEIERPLVSTECWYWHADVNVSNNHPYCKHHHPMIALDQAVHGPPNPIITWETDEGYTVVFRERIAANPDKWGPFTSEATNRNNLPLPLLRYQQFVCGSASTDRLEWVWQDAIKRQVFLTRINTAFKPSFSRIEEYAAEPSLSLPYTSDFMVDPGSITYRGTNADVNNCYAVKIAANPPQGEVFISDLKFVPSINIQDIAGGCGRKIDWKSDNASIIYHKPDTVIQRSVPWLPRPVGVFDVVPLNDTTGTLVQESWPRTEDSIQSVFFSTGDSAFLDMVRILSVDTTQLAALLNQPGSEISYYLVVKDSASGLTTQILDSAIFRNTVTGGGIYAGVDTTDTTMMGVGYHIQTSILPTSSGSAYLTMIWSKDSATRAALVLDQSYGPPLLLPTPDTSGVAYKKSQPHPTTTTASIGAMNISLHPNPASTRVLICVDAIPADNPFMAEVVSATGEHIATLYDATPEADLGLCYTLDCSQLADGAYYVRVANGILGGVVKFQVVR